MGRARSEDARTRADAALLRASRAALAAEVQEQRARAAPEWLHEVHEGLACFHRRAQARHETSAALQLAHAERLEAWAALGHLASDDPSLLAGIGELIGAESAVVLHGSDDTPALIATSSGLARHAVQLEYVLDEGPMHDCHHQGRAVSADDPTRVWPSYGRAAAGLGVWAVAANPLVAAGHHLGVLTTFNQPAVDATPLSTFAAAVTDSLLDLAPGLGPESPGWDSLGNFGTDDAAVVNCASGMVAAHRGCPPEEAFSFIRARAVTNGEQIEAVARRILEPGGLEDF